MKKRYKILIGLFFCLGLLASGSWAGYSMGIKYERDILNKKLSIIYPLREHNSNYKFIDPLLAYIIPSSDQEEKFTILKNKISDFINNEKNNNDLSDASVFFSDLNRGRWIGVNEKDKYNPASMLKVVIMVAYFKKAEKEPDTLIKNLTYTKDVDNLVKKDPFNSQSDLKIDKSYTVEDLINKMIIYSDNGAAILLLNNIDSSYMNSIYNVLNIDNPEKTKGDFIISPRAYSLFFRILYSSTYLSHNMSEKALDILSKTTFNDGLVDNLPRDIVVSHKFGEYIYTNNNQIQSIELHDCGIVYYKDYPYFLCVMTKGNNFESLKSVIKGVSDLVYNSYK